MDRKYVEMLKISKNIKAFRIIYFATIKALL